MPSASPATRLRGPLLGSLAAHAAVAAAIAGAWGWSARGDRGAGAVPIVQVTQTAAAIVRVHTEAPARAVPEAPPVDAPQVEEYPEAVPDELRSQVRWEVMFPDFALIAAPQTSTASATDAPSAASPPPAAPAAAATVDVRDSVPAAPVVLPPRVDPSGCPAPAYPQLARQRGLEGVAMLLLQVGADGRVLQAKLLESSGHAILDDAALAAARGWRLTPASADGVAVAGALRVPLRFRLER
jgi:protein TonB